MTHKFEKRFVLLLLSLVTLLAVGQDVQACVCSVSDDSTLGKFNRAQFVVVNKIVSVNKEPRLQVVFHGTTSTREPVMTITSITMIVEKVYKGNLKAGDEMIFEQGEGNCMMQFREEDVGASFLFYLEPGQKEKNLWYADVCGRSKPLPNHPTRYIRNAADDLLYLGKMNHVRGKTRLSGTLISYQWSIADGGADFKNVAGQKVQIVGNGKTYEALTNEDGVYEVYDLPAGTYAIRPEVKQGWEIDEGSAFGGRSSGSTEKDGTARVPLTVGGHAYANFIFTVHNRFSGHVLDLSGKPLQSVCLRLLPTQPNVSSHFKRHACTDADGSFEMQEIPWASYVVVINDDDKISSLQPFRRFYYPDVTDRDKAQVITIVEGQPEYLLDIHVPGGMEVVTVTGKVLSADSKPVVFARVAFTSELTDRAIDGNAFAMTDQQGNFSLNVLKGLSGKLVAAVMLDPNEFKQCPVLLRAGGEISLDRETEAIRIQADHRIDGVDLRLPFPSCNREKIQSRIKVD